MTKMHTSDFGMAHTGQTEADGQATMPFHTPNLSKLYSEEKFFPGPMLNFAYRDLYNQWTRSYPR